MSHYEIITRQLLDAIIARNDASANYLFTASDDDYDELKRNDAHLDRLIVKYRFVAAAVVADGHLSPDVYDAALSSESRVYPFQRLAYTSNLVATSARSPIV